MNNIIYHRIQPVRCVAALTVAIHALAGFIVAGVADPFDALGRAIGQTHYLVAGGQSQAAATVSAEDVAIEVKAETNLQAKRLKVYREKIQSKLSIRTSKADYKKEDWLLNLPLWAVDGIKGNYH